MIYLLLLEIGIIASHIAANKHHFTNIFFSFAMTFVLKRIMKAIDEKEKGSMISLAGYSIMLSHIILYLADVIKASKGYPHMGIDLEEFINKTQIEGKGAFDLDKNFKINIDNFKITR